LGLLIPRQIPVVGKMSTPAAFIVVLVLGFAVYQIIQWRRK